MVMKRDSIGIAMENGTVKRQYCNCKTDIVAIAMGHKK